VLLFTFKMLVEGRTAVPAAGMGAIPAQLAARLRPGAVRTGTEVATVDVRDGRARGVTLCSGETIAAAHVVLATELAGPLLPPLSPASAPPTPPAALGCTTLYFSADSAPLPGRALWLNAAEDAVVSHAVTITDVAPEYATADPPRRHLLAATAVGDAATLDDATLEARARAEVRTMRGTWALPGAFPDLRLVAIERVPYAQFVQPPGTVGRRASVTTSVARLWRAGETVHTSSLEGAARGGELAARAVADAGV
jgi:phytoene dehydrogenase-like protein